MFRAIRERRALASRVPSGHHSERPAPDIDEITPAQRMASGALASRRRAGALVRAPDEGLSLVGLSGAIASLVQYQFSGVQVSLAFSHHRMVWDCGMCIRYGLPANQHYTEGYKGLPGLMNALQTLQELSPCEATLGT